MGKYTKNGKIDFLKFLFAVVIVIHHGAKNVIDIENPLYTGGSLAVEFFFIVSGYLLMASISRLPDRTLPLGIETGKFMWRKIKGLYPEVAVAFVMGFVLDLLFKGRGFWELWTMSFHNLFLLKMTGVGMVTINAQTWYLSSMLLCMFILFPLIRKHPQMMANVVLPLVGLLFLGYLCINKTHPRDPSAIWKEFTYKGNIRAMAELSIGVSLYPLAQRLKQIKLSTLSRILLFLAEWGCYAVVFLYMRNSLASRLDYYYIAIFAVAILLSFSQQGIDANWYQFGIFSFLGKFSLALYLSHHCWAIHMKNLFPALSNNRRFAVYLVISFASAGAIMLVSFLLRKLGKLLKKPIRKLLLVQENQPAA